MNKVALITGGSRGIGYGIAESLAKAGFDLAINGQRTENEVVEVLEALRKFGVKVIYCQGDISSKVERESIISKIRTEFGRLNILVNNAGIAPVERNDILNTTEQSYDRVMDTNLKGTYFLTQFVANWMVTQKTESADYQGAIINISSISATIASVNRGEYCLSKAGMSMITQLFAVRLGEFDIPVYEVRPGVIHSDMTAAVTEKYNQLIANGLTIQKRWGQPDDVGKVVASIAAGGFQYSTGQVFMVDGGLTLGRL
ncbi:MAG: 3-ketoacyl-ACP reductase [Bacteroidota bacterium]